MPSRQWLQTNWRISILIPTIVAFWPNTWQWQRIFGLSVEVNIVWWNRQKASICPTNIADMWKWCESRRKFNCHLLKQVHHHSNTWICSQKMFQSICTVEWWQNAWPQMLWTIEEFRFSLRHDKTVDKPSQLEQYWWMRVVIMGQICTA